MSMCHHSVRPRWTAIKNNSKSIVPRILAAMRRQCAGSVHAVAAIIAKGSYVGLLAAGLMPHQAAVADDAAQLPNRSRLLSAHEGAIFPSNIEMQPVVAHSAKRAYFDRESASREARHVADWVVDSGDNRSMPFAIVDKTEAKVFVFHADGRLRGAAPALLGLARGDDAVPGIGDRALSGIRPEERTTPAGRFVVALDRNLHGKEILWVDYDNAISMHPVITTNPKEHRPQRLASPTPLDNRISYGCINVPAKFFANVVRPAFTGTNGIVYVLPETRSAQIVFASYDVQARARLQPASQPVPAQITSAAARH
jgi:hypothetical protein